MKCLRLLPLLLFGSVFAEEINIREGLGFRTPGARRSAVHTDPVELKLVKGEWKSPVDGQEGWAKIAANDKGEFQGGPTGGGYIYATVEAKAAKVMLLEASGHTMVYVNEVPRVGDPYSYGYVSLPVELKKGRNELLFLCGRGRLQAKLIDPPKPISFDLRDATTPEVIAGQEDVSLAGIVLRNATDKVMAVSVKATSEGANISTPAILMPMTNRKVMVALPTTKSGKVALDLFTGANQTSLDTSGLQLRVREKGQPYKKTFISKIDGSVQYYGVNPSTSSEPKQALFLSLHGASVEAIGQAEAYSAKSWGNLVAATNRRPYGFDWEEVGRLDALEVLDLAKKQFEPDSSRIYLTGHSMGGHGTWNIGANYPSLFAAIAPSAGWISFQSYAGGVTYTDPSPVEQMLVRASSPSNTLGLKYNYAPRGVFILHGDADDNVPVEQARTMRKELEPFHKNLQWHEEKGANHWWDASPEPGSDAVDFGPIFDFFDRQRLPSSSEVRYVDFTTASPGISSNLHWVSIQQQEKPYEFSRVQMEASPWLGKFTGTTKNVAAMSLSIAPMIKGQKISLEIDGQKLEPTLPTVNRIFIRKELGKWTVGGQLNPTEKTPVRSGNFKDVFKNNFCLVYATDGTKDENAWAFNKARYDAESFWYRGNGSVDVLADTEFDAKRLVDRNILLYGNSNTNKAWKSLVGDSPIQVSRGSIKVGAKEFKGDDLLAVFIRPRADSDVASVGVVAGTGLPGSRISERIPFFSSGAGFPDFLILGSDTLATGTKGIRAAGYFGNDWSLGSDIALHP